MSKHIEYGNKVFDIYIRLPVVCGVMRMHLQANTFIKSKTMCKNVFNIENIEIKIGSNPAKTNILFFSH